jgi:creatinine amidohydrolase
MHLVPGAVDAGAFPGGGTPPCWPDPHLFARAPITVWRGFEEINTTGVIGKPADASPERGEALFRAAVRRSAEAVSALLATYGRPAAAAPTDPAEGGA